MVAVAERKLPVRPGDYVIFHVTGHKLLVVMAQPQDVIDNRERGYPTSGQWLSGLMTRERSTSLTQILLDWIGYDDYWSIQRASD